MKSRITAIIGMLLCATLLFCGNSSISYAQTDYYWTGAAGDDLWVNPVNWLKDQGGTLVPTNKFPADTSSGVATNHRAFFVQGTFVINGSICEIPFSADLHLREIAVINLDIQIVQNGQVTLAGIPPERGVLQLSTGTFQHNRLLELRNGKLDFGGNAQWTSATNTETLFFQNGNGPANFVVASDALTIISNSNNPLIFRDLTFQYSGTGNDILIDGDATVARTFKGNTQGNCTATEYFGNGTIHLQGDINFANYYAVLQTGGSSQTTNFKIDGVNQNYFGNSLMVNGYIPNVEIACNTLNINGVFPVFGTLINSSGTLLGGMLNLYGEIALSGNDLTVDHLAITPAGSSDLIQLNGLTITVNGDLTMAAFNGCGQLQSGINTSHGYSLLSGAIEIRGNIFLDNKASNFGGDPTDGTTRIVLNGTTDQYIRSTVEEERCRLPFLTIDKGSGHGTVFIEGVVTVIHELSFTSQNEANLVTNHQNGIVDYLNPSLNLSLPAPTSLTEARDQYLILDNILVLSSNRTDVSWVSTSFPDGAPFNVNRNGSADNGHVVGVVKINGNMSGGRVTFPIGNQHLQEVSLSNYPDRESFMAQSFENPNVGANGAILPQGGLDHSTCEYWIIQPATYLLQWNVQNPGNNLYEFFPFTNGIPSKTVTLNWHPFSCSSILDECLIRVARFDDASGSNLWVSEGRSGTTGDFATLASSISSLSPNGNNAPLVEDFGAFTFGYVTPLSASTDIVPEDCSTGNNGSIEMFVSGGAPPYLYAINGSAFGLTPLFSGLSSGTYQIDVVDLFGCVYSQTILVPLDTTNCSPCINTGVLPDFTLVVNGQSISVSDNTSGGISYIEWSWGDGNSQLGFPGETTSHTYSMSGNYEVCLTTAIFLQDGTCCYDSLCLSAQVIEDPCLDFTAMISYTASGSGAFSYDFFDMTPTSDVSIWDFGDGATAIGSGNNSVVSHSFSSNSQHTITLISIDHINDTLCCIDTTQISVGGGSKPNNLRVEITPNPTKGIIKIDLMNFMSRTSLVRIHTVHGNVIEEFEQAPNGRFNYNATNLPDGMYLVTAISGETSVTQRFVKH